MPFFTFWPFCKKQGYTISETRYILVMRAVTDPENDVDDRPKNFLTEAEVENFLKAGRKGRHKVRNFAMSLLVFRHGLRVSELINMRMADVDLDIGRLFVRRVKGGLSTSLQKERRRPGWQQKGTRLP